MRTEPMSPTSTLADTTVDRPQKVTLPNGYTLYAFPAPLGDYYDGFPDGHLKVSVYPPGSDCTEREDCVAELIVHREEVDVLLKMYG